MEDENLLEQYPLNPQTIPGNMRAAWETLSKFLILSSGSCKCCGKHRVKMAVHHKNSCGLDNRIENLVVLCNSCHKKVHQYAKYKNRNAALTDGVLMYNNGHRSLMAR